MHLFKLYSVTPKDERSYNLNFDKSDILVEGAGVFKHGVQAGPNPARVEAFCEERNLIFIREEGYSAHISRMDGSSYEPAKIAIYEYEEKPDGNKINIMVKMFPQWEFALRGGQTDIEKWWKNK